MTLLCLAFLPSAAAVGVPFEPGPRRVVCAKWSNFSHRAAYDKGLFTTAVSGVIPGVVMFVPFRSSLSRLGFVCTLTCALPVSALAQFQPPGAIPGAVAPGANPAAQSVRIDRLENRVRELTGQVEELQFQVRRLEQQLQRFQQDVEARWQERGGAGAPPAARAQPQRRGEPSPPVGGGGPSAPPIEVTGDFVDDPGRQASVQPGTVTAPGAAGRAGRRGDAFDPAENPGAPGAPRALSPNAGPYVPSAPARRLPGGPLEPDEPGAVETVEDPNAPLDLSRPRAALARTAPAPAEPLGAPRGVGAPPVVPSQPSVGVLPGVPGQQVVTPGSGAAPSAPNRYQLALAALKENRFDEAEQELRAFIDQNPQSRSLPDAVFNLGLTYERRGRHREAAEQYLKVTQSYERSPRAPESMLRLGLALERLGAREQACATWQEASRKYPQASGGVRTGLERQIKRAQCA